MPVVVQDEGTPLTPRMALNFIGSGVTATDDAANSRTNVTIGSGGGGVSSMTVAAFDAETTTGTLNPSGRGLVQFTNSPHQALWNGSAWEYYFRGGKHGRVPTTGWSTDNPGAAVITNSLLHDSIVNGPADGLRYRYRTAPATPYTATFILGYSWYASDVYQTVGAAFRKSSTGQLITLVLGQSSSNTFFVGVSKWNNTGSYNADYIVETGSKLTHYIMQDFIYVQLADDGVNLKLSYSQDAGLTWRLFWNPPRADFMSGGPDQIAYGFEAVTTFANRSILIGLTLE